MSFLTFVESFGFRVKTFFFFRISKIDKNRKKTDTTDLTTCSWAKQLIQNNRCTFTLNTRKPYTER